ncbi:hypothetical protein V8G54_003054 [Vigna mungo]|uniref:Retrotransposon gag domain-containing protein n=1 Tax=Vigna mungo TaxID=3915 RepID=A0AAQ3P9T7_VIGMU
MASLTKQPMSPNLRRNVKNIFVAEIQLPSPIIYNTQFERKRYRREGEENRTVEARTERSGKLIKVTKEIFREDIQQSIIRLRSILGYVTIGPTCRIVQGGNCRIVREEKKLENLGLSMRGLETKVEAMEERARQLEENFDVSQAYVNGKKEDQRKEVEGERDGGCHEEQPNWRKGVELPIFDGVDPLNWISKVDNFFELQGVSEEEKLCLAYISMERSAGFWFRFWREHTGNRTWTGLKEVMVLRFGGRNQGPIFERLATKYNQPLNGKELLESNGSNARGLPEPNSSRLLDPNVRERAEPKERGLAEPNGRVLREPIGSGLTNSNVRGLPEPNDSGLTNSNVRGLPEPNGSELTNSNMRELPEANGRRLLDPNVREWAEPKERGPTKPNKRGRPELTVRKLSEPNGLVLEGRMKVLVGRVDGRINALERTKNSLKLWTIEKNRGLVIFDTLAEGRERCEVWKDIEDHFLKTYDSGKRVNKILNEEWKTLEEVLPPPKPPELNWRATASEYRPYDNMRMKGSQEIKFHSSNLEDKVVLQRGVMLGAGKYMIGAGKCRRGRGIGEKENRTERSGNRTVEAGTER